MRFNHVTLIVTDFERSKEFYRTLGLVQIVDSPPRYARFRFSDGDATLSIEVTGELAVASRAGEWPASAIPTGTNSVSTARARTD
jgi:catechol 2,3-dioxygenase-like lactoylglutathione lyase family enzyme